MKVLIVDDEQHVREAIRLLVDWDVFGIHTIIEAQDGDTAAELIANEKPQIVFTDMMMPGKSGTQLLEWMKINAPQTRTIVISGHDDFDLARQTIKYGGMDYILKPIDPEQLNEAVAKAVTSRRLEDEGNEQSQLKSIEINQFKPVYWDSMLTRLVDDPSYYQAVSDTLTQEFGLTSSVQSCRVAVLATDTIEPGIRSKFEGSGDLLMYSLLNICNEFVRKDRQGIAFRYGGGDIAIILWRNTAAVKDLLENINNGIDRALKCKFEFGLGTIKQLPAGLKLSFQEAVIALRQRNIRNARQRIHSYDAQAGSKHVTLHLSDYEDQLRFALRSGQDALIKDAVRLLIEKVRQLEYINVEQLELWRHEYNVIKARWNKELFGDNQQALQLPSESAHFIVPLDQAGRLSPDKWGEELEEGLIRLSKLWFKLKNHDEHIIFEIAQYIETHYEYDLSLQDIADRFYLSREYISRKFKQQFQVNLSDFLERIRIGKAKLLLMNPNYRIVQIAEMVGYHDEKYFSKVFKKLESISPNEFRKRNL